jgi:multiple sugar transport system substrate-binding protein
MKMKANQSSNTVQCGISRRDFLRMSGAAGGLMLAAACTVAPPAPQEESSEPSGGEVTTISWWSPWGTDPKSLSEIPRVVTGFEEKHPNIRVEYEISGGPPGGGDFTEVLLARIAAGNPPDSVTIWSPPVQFAVRGALEAIDDFMADAQLATPDAFYEGPLNTCRWQGSIFGLPASAGAGSMYYNVEMFAEKGLPTAREEFPKTWDELIAVSKEFEVWEGDELVQAGFVPWGESWLKPVWSGLNGGMLYDAESNRYVIDSEENIEWLTIWLQWLEDQYGGDLEQLNLFGPWEGVGPDSNFNKGLAAMTQGGSWSITQSWEFPFEYEVARYPVGPSGTNSVTGYWPNWFAIPHNTGHPNEAFLFIEYYCTEGWVIWYESTNDTPAWRNFPEGVITADLIEREGMERAQDLHNFFEAYLEETVDMWHSPVDDFVSDTLDAAIDEVLHKTKSPDVALQEAQALAQQRLEEVTG